MWKFSFNNSFWCARNLCFPSVRIRGIMANRRRVPLTMLWPSFWKVFKFTGNILDESTILIRVDVSFWEVSFRLCKLGVDVNFMNKSKILSSDQRSQTVTKKIRKHCTSLCLDWKVHLFFQIKNRTWLKEPKNRKRSLTYSCLYFDPQHCPVKPY